MIRPTLLACLALCGCGGAAVGRRAPRPVRVGPPVELPERIDETTFRRARHALCLVPDDDASRAAPVRRLVEYKAARCTEALERSDREAASEAFDEALALYPTGRLARSAPDASLAPCAEGIVRAFSPRGDEARVAAALTVLARLRPEDPRPREELEALLTWSRAARAKLASPVERFGGMSDVLEGIVSRVPDPERVEELSHLYVARHSALLALLQSGFDGTGGTGIDDLRRASIDVARTSFDIARLHVRLDDADTALRVLRSLGDLPGIDEEIVAALEHLGEDPLRGLLEMATLFVRSDPDTALAVCRRGRLAYPDDARFAECLGMASAQFGDVDGAAAHYDDAMRLEPGSFELHDQALELHARTMESALEDDDLARARPAYERAVELLSKLRREWPQRRISIEPHALHFAMGMGEFNGGHIGEAVEAFTASVEDRPNRPALVQLGIVSERRGQFPEARRIYRRALDLRPDDPRADASWRAQILERLGDASRAAGEVDQAERHWREAVASWDEALRPRGRATLLSPTERANAHLRKAILFDRLGEPRIARESFDVALASARGNREIYGRLLSYLVARGRVDQALEVYHRVLSQASLPEEWKIYYALWVVGAQRRGGAVQSDEAISFLRGVSGDGWQQRLARFYAGTLTYDELLRHARTTGERAEAHFYQALLLLAAGQRDPAADLLRQVLDSDMMGFFEYDMAREMLVALR